jgi:hypothetical protein
MDDLERRVREYVHKLLPWLPVEMPDTSDVLNNGTIYGDDVDELIDGFRKTFRVSLENYRWYHHTGPDGCNPLWLISRPWWARKKYVPIGLLDLVESARCGKWTVQYPESQREPDR